jgi:hypothetical protein
MRSILLVMYGGEMSASLPQVAQKQPFVKKNPMLSLEVIIASFSPVWPTLRDPLPISSGFY